MLAQSLNPFPYISLVRLCSVHPKYTLKLSPLWVTVHLLLAKCTTCQMNGIQLVLLFTQKKLAVQVLQVQPLWLYTSSWSRGLLQVYIRGGEQDRQTKWMFLQVNMLGSTCFFIMTKAFLNHGWSGKNPHWIWSQACRSSRGTEAEEKCAWE